MHDRSPPRLAELLHLTNDDVRQALHDLRLAGYVQGVRMIDVETDQLANFAILTPAPFSESECQRRRKRIARDADLNRRENPAPPPATSADRQTALPFVSSEDTAAKQHAAMQLATPKSNTTTTNQRAADMARRSQAPRCRQIIETIRHHGPLTRHEIHTRGKIPMGTLCGRCNELLAAGYLVLTGEERETEDGDGGVMALNPNKPYPV